MADLNDEDRENKESKSIKDESKELSIEEKLKDTEDKLLRSLAEQENQRSRFEKEIKEAIDFGGFSFARENLAILDNLQRAHNSIKNDPNLKNNKDVRNFLKTENINNLLLEQHKIQNKIGSAILSKEAIINNWEKLLN